MRPRARLADIMWQIIVTSYLDTDFMCINALKPFLCETSKMQVNYNFVFVNSHFLVEIFKIYNGKSYIPFIFLRFFLCAAYVALEKTNSYILKNISRCVFFC